MDRRPFFLRSPHHTPSLCLSLSAVDDSQLYCVAQNGDNNVADSIDDGDDGDEPWVSFFGLPKNHKNRLEITYPVRRLGDGGLCGEVRC